MNPHRWIEVTPSAYAWEREALEYLKGRLPDGEPFRAWSNFEFIAHDGSINEVDLLVVSLHAVYLVEIKSWRGTVDGDQSTWRRTVDGRTLLVDSPLLLANRKARKLAALLKEQPALRRERAPYLDAVVFLSRGRCRLDGLARTGVYLSTESAGAAGPSIVDVLSGNAGFDPRHPPPRVDRPRARAFARAMEQAGIRPSQRQRRVADYVLRELLLETDRYQDWKAEHATVSSSKRRIRIYPCAGTAGSRATAQRNAAEREYRLLDGVTHDGILRVELLTDAEHGPAVVFEHDPNAEPLDHFLARRGDGLAPEVRLHLMRQLAETLRYAHERRLYHRGLSPQRVLVLEGDAPRPRLKIFDWQTGKYVGGNGTPSGAPATTSLAVAGDDRNAVYRAPEASLGEVDAGKLDLFSLGAIAYRLFAGTPPAPTVEALHARLAGGHGLKLSDELDGVPESLQFVVECATDPDVTARPDSVAEFLEQLDAAEQELAADREPREEAVHPLDAGPDDLLGHGFRVVRRLGRGATAVALQVTHDDGGTGVLKVALDPSHHERIVREGELLRSLRHPHVVEAYRELEVGGHAAIFMAMAGADNKSGAYTLADRIREEGRLSLDLLQRFGDQLLNVVQWLEEQGVSHRDLKPDNIGVAGTPLSIVVFDFSLADTPADQIRAGTPQYRDPFLPLRTPPRWDVYAEHFAAAMTLHEMATGQLPSWGDGGSAPSLIDAEVRVDAEQFDPAIREALTTFFETALARDYRDRYDNAEELRRAWFGCFASIDAVPGGDEAQGELPADFAGVTEATALQDLGLSARLLNALERMGAHTVAQLVGLPRIRLYRNRGIGQRSVKRIRELSKRLDAHLEQGGRPIEAATAVEDGDHGVDPEEWSVDLLAARLTPASATGRAAEDAYLVRGALGLDDHLDRLLSQRAVAEQQSTSSPEVRRALRRAQDRWQRQGWIRPLRDTVAALVARQGGVMTAPELAEALAAARGSTAAGDERLRRAGAAVAAALETEAARADCRYRLYGNGSSLVLATAALDAGITAPAAARADWARALGALADRLATADPLASPARVLEEIAEVEPPSGMPRLGADRSVRLAARVAARAALSSRGELYPRRMAAQRAVKLGASSLLGARSLTVGQLRERLRSRYPEAAPLPERPALDALLDAAGLRLIWDHAHDTYRARTPHPSRHDSGSTTAAADTDGDADGADTIDERLRRAVAAQGFLALSVPPRYLLHAERYLAERFALAPCSLEAALIRHMRALAADLGADWNRVLAADAAPPGSPDHRRLHQLVRRAAATLRREIGAATAPLLLTRGGLLARYRRLDLLAALQDDCQRGTAPAARVLCIARRTGPSRPVIDGQALPVVMASAWAQPGAAWLARTATGGIA